MNEQSHNSAEFPPAWAEALLRRLLEPRDRDVVAGYLLEEYREAVIPSRGLFRARTVAGVLAFRGPVYTPAPFVSVYLIWAAFASALHLAHPALSTYVLPPALAVFPGSIGAAFGNRFRPGQALWDRPPIYSNFTGS